MKVLEAVQKIQFLQFEIEEMTKLQEELRANKNISAPVRSQLANAYDIQIEISLDRLNHLQNQLDKFTIDYPIEELHKQHLMPKAYNVTFKKEVNGTEEVCELIVIEHSEKDAVKKAASKIPNGYILSEVKANRNSVVYNGHAK